MKKAVYFSSAALFVLLVTGILSTDALECHSCKKAETNEECNDETPEECKMNDPMCITEAKNQDGVILLDKGCKESEACLNNEASNPPECADGLVANKCRYCCADYDLCNNETLNFTAIDTCDEGGESGEKEPTGQCYSCSGKTSNDDCMDIEDCTMNDPGCQTELTNVGGVVHVSKRCKQRNSCENNQDNNKDECADGIVEQKCQYCCIGDLCNGEDPTFEEQAIECGPWGNWSACGIDCSRTRDRTCVYTVDGFEYVETDMEACEIEGIDCTLLCYVCEGEYDNAVCRDLSDCPVGQFCQNVMEGDCNGDVFVAKGCQVYDECDAATRANPESCDQISPFGDLTDYQLGNGEKCSYCCTGNYCNGPLVPREALQVGGGAAAVLAVPLLVAISAALGVVVNR